MPLCSPLYRYVTVTENFSTELWKSNHDVCRIFPRAYIDNKKIQPLACSVYHGGQGINYISFELAISVLCSITG